MKTNLKLCNALLIPDPLLIIVWLFSALLYYQPVSAQPHPCEWKFYLAFEDATGARDTLWMVWHPDGDYLDLDTLLGEILYSRAELDSGQFIVSWGPESEYILKTYVPDYCFTGFLLFAYNYQLPITVSWDTTHFQSPALTAPDCVGIGWNTYGAGVTNGLLVNDYILDYSYNVIPSPFYPWYGVIMFFTSIELIDPMWPPWFTHFPLGFDLKCGNPNETPWSTRNLRSEPELHVYPNPVSDKLHIQTQLRWYSAEVYSVHGTRILTTSATVERNIVPTYSLPPGMYLLVLYDEYGKAVGRSRFVKI